LKENYVISIDMGGTKILSAAINSKEGVIKRVKKATDKNVNQNSYVKTLVEIVEQTISEAELEEEQVKAVCLGIPGSLNPYTGKIAVAPNLGIRNLNIIDRLKKHISYPVLIENDVNLGALGIRHFGLGKNSKDMLVVFIGTGIGGALIFDGKLFRGANNAAGEIGHMHVMNGGPLCGCGKKGCLESVASRTAIVKAIQKDIKADKKSILTKLVDPGKPIKSKSLATAVDKGDKVVTKHITEACETIGYVLSDITNLLNLDLIVLGGGMIEALDYFMVPIIKETFHKNVLKASAKGLKIVPTKLGDDAALYGGIALAEEFLGIKV
jgi:glucokinase